MRLTARSKNQACTTPCTPCRLIIMFGKLRMRAYFVFFAFLVAVSLPLLAGEPALKQKDVGDFYAMCWRELGSIPPKLERPIPESLPRQLQGLYRYECRDAVSGSSVKGSITFRYPEWDWPSDASKGSAKQFGDKIVLLGNGDDSKMRAFLLRIKSEWHIMQMDFPARLVKLT